MSEHSSNGISFTCTFFGFIRIGRLWLRWQWWRRWWRRRWRQVYAARRSPYIHRYVSVLTGKTKHLFSNEHNMRPNKPRRNERNGYRCKHIILGVRQQTFLLRQCWLGIAVMVASTWMLWILMHVVCWCRIAHAHTPKHIIIIQTLGTINHANNSYFPRW